MTGEGPGMKTAYAGEGHWELTRPEPTQPTGK
jgi:hypothetical protein